MRKRPLGPIVRFDADLGRVRGDPNGPFVRKNLDVLAQADDRDVTRHHLDGTDSRCRDGDVNEAITQTTSGHVQQSAATGQFTELIVGFKPTMLLVKLLSSTTGSVDARIRTGGGGVPGGALAHRAERIFSVREAI